MARNLRQIAKDATTLSHLMNGREKIETSELIKKYPNGIHITAADLVPNPKGEPYAVIQFKENEHLYYCGGLILTKIVRGMLEACENDFAVMNEELMQDPIGVKLTETKASSSKNNLTAVEILDK